MDSQQLQEADDLISQLEAQLAAKLQTATPSQPGDPWWEEEEEAITSEAIASRAAIREHLEEKTQQDYEARASAAFSAAASRAAAASENSLDASNGDKALTAFSESLSRCPDATRSRIQAVARTVTRHGHTASATTRLTVVGALLPEDVTHVTPLLDALRAAVPSVRMQTAVVEAEQSPAPPAALRAARSAHDAHTLRATQYFDALDDPAMVFGLLDTAAARRLLLRKVDVPEADAASPMVWRLVNVPGVGWAPLPSAEDCGPKLPCRRWSELNEAERAEVIASARKRLLGSSEFHDLALQSASEVWIGGDGDETIETLCLRGHLRRSQLQGIVPLLSDLLSSVLDVIVEIGVMADDDDGVSSVSSKAVAEKPRKAPPAARMPWTVGGKLEQPEEDEEGDEEVVVELEPPEPPVEVSEPPRVECARCHRRRVPSASNLESWYAAVHAYSGAAASGGYGSLQHELYDAVHDEGDLVEIDGEMALTREQRLCGRCVEQAAEDIPAPTLLYELLPTIGEDDGSWRKGLRWNGGRIRKPLGGSVSSATHFPGVVCMVCNKPWRSGPLFKCATRESYHECADCHERQKPKQKQQRGVFVRVARYGGGLDHLFPSLNGLLPAAGGEEASGEQASSATSQSELLTALFTCPPRDNKARWSKWMRDFFAASSAIDRPMSMKKPSEPIVLSERGPKVLLVRNFLSGDECDHMIRLGMQMLSPSGEVGSPLQSASGMLPASARATDGIVASIEERIAKLSGIPTHADEDELNLVYRPESGKVGEGGGPALVNLHIDARLGRPYSACTVLVYLNDVSAGGGTAFPCVDQDEGLNEKYASHHRSGHDYLSVASCSSEEEHELLLVGEHVARRTPGAGGLVTKPERGSAVAFWSLNPTGGEDLAALDDKAAASPTWETWEREPLAWHGGVRVLPGGNGKWILQKFKELEAGVRGGGV